MQRKSEPRLLSGMADSQNLSSFRIVALLSFVYEILPKQIDRELKQGAYRHCAIYEVDLQRLWPLDEKDREAKIARFAKDYGVSSTALQKGALCNLRQATPRHPRLA